jgi:hypothetical protein
MISAALAAAALAGCGGGGESSTSPSVPTPPPVAQSAVSTFITDNLNTAYSQVWIGLTDISLVDATGKSVSLFHSSTPSVFNLSSLASVASMLSTATVPQGSYVKAVVTMDDKVQLVPRDGSATINATFKGDGTPTVLPVEIQFTPNSTDQLVLDFDLAKFDYNATTGHVTPSVAKSAKKGGDSKDFHATEAHVNGIVSQVGVDGLTVTDKHLGEQVRLKVTSNTVIVDVSNGKSIPLANVAVGARVEAEGPVTSTNPPLVAVTSVRVVPASQGSNSGSEMVHGEGKVAVVTNSSVTVNIEKATFLPGASQVVVDITNAHYAHGVAGDLHVGTGVSFEGKVTVSGVAAQVIDIQGGLSDDDRTKHPEAARGEVHGTVTSVTGAIAQVTSDRPLKVSSDVQSVAVATTVAVDMSNAVFTRGALSCVVPGKVLEASGRADSATSLSAQVVELEHGCDAPAAAPTGH